MATGKTTEFVHPASVTSWRSPVDFYATLTRVIDALKQHGMTIFADIDQSAAAASAGLALRPTRLLLFGNPKGGTPVMAANPHAGLELPLKVMVWAAAADDVRVDFLNPGPSLSALYGIDASQAAGFGGVAKLFEVALAG
ncbi:DUF302 domain-containing protein [Pandoraea fibrosis]|uniref:DUF302 domain-containing protein n=1 Tax=Pandoraea fibrosis TaxID=1891094 RepID=A0A5E4YBF9_9BURK|nr:DUF302 domain-containing protein [Pandoraea fibrosis]QHE94364.1 DUF302 domain-containing protein [Pandoraea fibrosis]QHF12072.1 DUF302 domain-containing protein [Pandoraea fibrosis]VVE45473.1 hypothetical protein PFI31113_04357 [Pandoraea fibrosis]